MISRGHWRWMYGNWAFRGTVISAPAKTCQYEFTRKKVSKRQGNGIIYCRLFGDCSMFTHLAATPGESAAPTVTFRAFGVGTFGTATWRFPRNGTGWNDADICTIMSWYHHPHRLKSDFVWFWLIVVLSLSRPSILSPAQCVFAKHSSGRVAFGSSTVGLGAQGYLTASAGAWSDCSTCKD